MVRRHGQQRSDRRNIKGSATGHSTAIASAPSDDPLLKSEERLRLAGKGSPMGLWYSNEDTGRVFSDTKARDTFGVNPGGEKTSEIFYACGSTSACRRSFRSTRQRANWNRRSDERLADKRHYLRRVPPAIKQSSSTRSAPKGRWDSLGRTRTPRG